MKVKNETVNLDLDIMILGALKWIEKAVRSVEGQCYEVTITSGRDGKHMQGSKHYLGLAIDIRTRDMKNQERVLNSVKKILGSLYDVILESDHMHIEFDPKI